MTTIAFDGKTIAADSRCTSGGVLRSDNTKKLHELAAAPWKLLAWSGEGGDLEPVKAWLKNGMDRKEQPKVSDLSCLLVDLDGAVWEMHTIEGHIKICQAEDGEQVACGSGYAYALAAMKMGRRAREAVEFAMTIDMSTGGTVTTYDIATGELTRHG